MDDCPDANSSDYHRLYYKYAHVGCPAAKYEDNCGHPDLCAENGRCLDLPTITPDVRDESRDKG